MGRRREHQGQLILLRLLLGSPTPPPSLATRTARYFFPAYSIPPSQLVISTASDVLHDLNRASDVDPSAINSTERPRLVHSHGTATSSDGGLGIRPDNDRVHDGPSTTLNLTIVGFTLSRDDRYSLHDITRSQVRASIPTTWFPLRSAVRRRRRSISISWLPKLISLSLSSSLAPIRSSIPSFSFSGLSSLLNTGAFVSAFMLSHGAR